MKECRLNLAIAKHVESVSQGETPKLKQEGGYGSGCGWASHPHPNPNPNSNP